MQGLNKIKLLFILIMCLVFSLSGCNNKTDENQDNIIGKKLTIDDILIEGPVTNITVK